MARLVEVWNDNDLPFVQEFKGEVITIAPHKYVKMDRDDAVEFKSKGFPMAFDGSKNQKKSSFKRIRVEGLYAEDEATETVTAFICHKDGSLHPSKESLEKHVSENFTDSLEDQDVAKALKQKGQKRA